MRVVKLCLSNFRCFGATPTVIDLDDLTVLIGTNGTGKTALLTALLRLFGSRATDRTLDFSDFHLPPGADANSVKELKLWIEAWLEFPEGAASPGVPECFRQMAVSSAGAEPFCRIRLDATWMRNETSGGDVDILLNWIVASDSNPPEKAKRRVSAQDRGNISVIYVPASRDPSAQLRQVSGMLLQPLLKAIKWSSATRTTVTESAESVRDAVRKEVAVQALENEITAEWKALQSLAAFTNVQLQPLSSEFESLVRQIEAVFSSEPPEATSSQPLDRLSDGLRSLFYFSLVGARFSLEQQAGKNANLFDLDVSRLPALTLFAIEEPENHLAPHYLSRILALLTKLSDNTKAQVILSSQSPSVLGRIDPGRVRHFQLAANTSSTSVHRILLPDESDIEAFKYVKEAVRAFPELYFAKVVILGEGDSEEIVLPRAARCLGQKLDQTFVSVVPLGGRHVNHFWRLLNDLQITHVTLLDLDRERQCGGWSRIKYALDELVRLRPGFDLNALGLTPKKLKEMSGWDLSEPANVTTILDSWLRALEQHDVFFSAPLDLDFMLLESFMGAYQGAGGDGPRIPATGPELSKRLDSAREAVLKSEGGQGLTYSPEQRRLFLWYQYLFLGRGKPITHMRALNAMTDEELAAGLPSVLKNLLGRCAVLAEGRPA
jgi:putative ATP-dependent endonuclease of OLD family